MSRDSDGMTEDVRIAFAKVGLDALIDEATGHQAVRPTNALREAAEQYMHGDLSMKELERIALESKIGRERLRETLPLITKRQS